MKYGMNLLLWTGHVTSEQFPLLAKLKQTGFDGVELPLFMGDAAHYKTVRKELDANGLGCTAVTVVNANNNPISPDAAIRQAGLDHIKSGAGDDGHSRRRGRSPGRITRPLASSQVRGQPLMRRNAAPTCCARRPSCAAGQGQARHRISQPLRVLFSHDRGRRRALVKAVDHPWFRMMYDTFHANIEEKQVAGVIEAVADSTIHVHISENDRGTPGTGHVQWDETFKALKKIKYDGWMTIEAFGRALPDLAAATRVWRDLFPNAEEVYTQGLRFMKSKWAAA